jgi:hypothetical protein
MGSNNFNSLGTGLSPILVKEEEKLIPLINI